MHNDDKPLISSNENLPEITIKAIFIAVVLTIILTASNAYLALKVGTTISASIPAAIMAMGVLRFFKRHNVLETNIIQTAASAGEAVVAAIAYTIPALVMMHYWQHFDYWEIVLICLLGGILGVLFSVPLRRVLLADKTLPFPEGTAIGKVLRATASAKRGVKLLVNGGLVGAVLTFCQAGLEILADHFDYWWGRSGSTVFGGGFGFSSALLAAGFIVGLQVAIALLVAVVVFWLIGIPVLSHVVAVPAGLNATDASTWIWLHQIRYIGVGTMLIGGLWLLITMAKSIVVGIKKSFKALETSKYGESIKLPRVDRDIPVHYSIAIAALLMIPMYAYLYTEFRADILQLPFVMHIFITLVLVVFVFIMGFLISSICGYFAGLIGSTNSPLSGMILISLILGAFLLMLLMFKQHLDAGKLEHLAALTVLFSALVGTAGAISIDTIQDLKAGQMVGATPWKQQVMLMIGVVVAAFVTPLILNLLFNAYGIGDVFPHAGMSQAQALSAPQGQLIQSVVMGVFGHDLNWPMVYVGMVAAVVCIIIDEILKRRGYRLPVLAVGIGIYLPIDITLPMILGGFLSGLVTKKHEGWIKQGKAEKAHEAHESVILLACGLVAGATLMGVILAVPFVIYQSSDALAIMPAHLVWLGNILGAASIVLLLWWLYRTAVKNK